MHSKFCETKLLLTSLLDINGHFPKSILQKGLGLWLTLIIPQLVCSFTTSARDVNLYDR